ncbi:hypothetical protein Tco_1406040 [Tanacetum coccineum]
MHFLELEVVEKLLEVEMLVGLSNHWVKVMLIFGLLEALEMEALVDAMDIDSGGLSFKESFIGLFRSERHLVVLVVERIKRVKMTCLDDEKMKKIRNDVPCHVWHPLSCLLKEQLLEPALNLTVHCCGLEF